MDFDDSPIFMIRLVAETGCIMNGGAAQVGSVGATVFMRSWTSCRARRTSVPRLKSSVMCESCGTDSERMVSTPGTPFRASSSGTVTSSSTSDAESPRHAVWSSTRVGANSGNTSTFSLRSSRTPKNTSATAAATTRKRNLRLDPTIQRIALGPSVLFDPVLDAQELLGADGHHPCAGRWPGAENRERPHGAGDADRRPDKGQRAGARVGEGVPLGVVDDRRVRDHGGV